MKMVDPVADSKPAAIPAFIGKLWHMVNSPETDNLISWGYGGTTFVIRDQNKFSSEVLPKYYKHNNMASFIRQLNLYDFHRVYYYGIDKIVSNTPQKGMVKTESGIEFSNPYFCRDEPLLLKEIRRKPVAHSKENTDLKMVDHGALNKLLGEVKRLRTIQEVFGSKLTSMKQENAALWREHSILRQRHVKQEAIVNKLIHFLVSMVQQRMNKHNVSPRNLPLMIKGPRSSHPTKKKFIIDTGSGTIREVDPDMYEVQSPGEAISVDTLSTHSNTASPGTVLNVEELPQVIRVPPVEDEADQENTDEAEQTKPHKADKKEKKVRRGTKRKHHSTTSRKKRKDMKDDLPVTLLNELIDIEKTSDRSLKESIEEQQETSEQSMQTIIPSPGNYSESLPPIITSPTNYSDQLNQPLIIVNPSMDPMEGTANSDIQSLGEVISAVDSLGKQGVDPVQIKLENLDAPEMDEETEATDKLDFINDLISEEEKHAAGDELSLIPANICETITSDPDAHLTKMQSELDVLKDLLQTEGMSLDVNTIMEIFNENPLGLNLPMGDPGPSTQLAPYEPSLYELRDQIPLEDPNLKDPDLDDDQLISFDLSTPQIQLNPQSPIFPS